MSIPDRLWRVVKGHYQLAKGKTDQVQARADAYSELTEYLRKTSLPRAPRPPAAPADPAAGSRPHPTYQPPPEISYRPGVRDPMRACYELLGAQPGCTLEALEQAYERRGSQLQPQEHPPGSAARAAVEKEAEALSVAYEKLRDALNPTETRFENLEF